MERVWSKDNWTCRCLGHHYSDRIMRVSFFMVQIHRLAAFSKCCWMACKPDCSVPSWKTRGVMHYPWTVRAWLILKWIEVWGRLALLRKRWRLEIRLSSGCCLFPKGQDPRFQNLLT